METIACNVGRLVEIRVSSPVTLEEAQRWPTLLRDALASTKGLAILCADLRHATVLPQEVAKILSGAMRQDNPKIEKSAILIKPDFVFGMQLDRLIKEALNPNRQAFDDQSKMIAWLSPALSKEELARVTVFLSERPLPGNAPKP